ncbi:LicD family protein [Holdemania massiliensis]|uniref:LicD family protein n=1 Tax=Holdemania massiliensis TaxID=1468449 RepID=UPI001F06CF6A|nr:LicD family protein [Holdemania massiliensis]MCH1940959.1 LicD family protein [Holdemania massiliensis]
MKKLTLDEMKAVELDVLCKIHEICISQGINYSLAYGTLLGAIRHKGFIPWDDDIDLLMPRDDYEKFMEYCASHETPFYVISHRTDPTWPFLYTRVCDPNTVIPDEPIWKWRGKMGLFVDIIAVDGLGNTFKQATCNLYGSVFKLSIANASNWSHFFKTRTRFKWYYDPIRFCFYVMGKFIKPNRLLNSVEIRRRKCSISSVKYSGEVGGAFAYGKKEIMESSIFTEFTDVEFEGKTFKAFKEYDKFLTHVYGDYMTPPPKEQQIGHHYLTAYGRE